MPSSISGDDGFVTSAGGIVLQTRYAVFALPKTISVAAMTVTEISELAVHIKPKSDRSVFKLELNLPHEAISDSTENIMFSATRNGSYIQQEGIGNRNGGISPRTISFHRENSSTLDLGSFVYIDEPATDSEITYTPAFMLAQNDTMHLNRTADDVDTAIHERGMSTFIVTELSPVYD